MYMTYMYVHVHVDRSRCVMTCPRTRAAVNSLALLLLLQDRENPEVQSRLGTIERRYKDLLNLATIRKQKLLDALALYQLYNEADNVEQWIAEKVGPPVPTTSQLRIGFDE